MAEAVLDNLAAQGDHAADGVAPEQVATAEIGTTFIGQRWVSLFLRAHAYQVEGFCEQDTIEATFKPTSPNPGGARVNVVHPELVKRFWWTEGATLRLRQAASKADDERCARLRRDRRGVPIRAEGSAEAAILVKDAAIRRFNDLSGQVFVGAILRWCTSRKVDLCGRLDFIAPEPQHGATISFEHARYRPARRAGQAPRLISSGAMTLRRTLKPVASKAARIAAQLSRLQDRPSRRPGAALVESAAYIDAEAEGLGRRRSHALV